MPRKTQQQETREHPLAVWRNSQKPPLTQKEIAEKWEVSKGYIAQIETFQRKPGARMIDVIRANTSITADELLDVPLREPTRQQRDARRARTTTKRKPHRHAAKPSASTRKRTRK